MRVATPAPMALYRIGSPSPTRLDRFLREQEDASLSYSEIGASMGQLPRGYLHATRETLLGPGRTTYERAVAALISWRSHRSANVTVLPPGAPVALGTTVALVVPAFGLHVVGACRIVKVVDESWRFGFAYGTLTGHPEQGEEAFVVERTRDGVLFRIRAFSRPRTHLGRLSAPLVRVAQRRITDQYTRGLLDY